MFPLDNDFCQELIPGGTPAYKRRGKRRVDLNQLPLRAMLHWLLRVVEAWLGVKESMPSERPFWP